MIKLYPCGTKAISVLGNKEGLLTGKIIRDNHIQYGFSYFDAGEFKTAWMKEAEFTTDIKKTQKIGYK